LLLPSCWFVELSEVLAQPVAQAIELVVAVLEQPDKLSAGVVFDHAGQSGHQRRHVPSVSLHGDDELFERHVSTVAPAGAARIPPSRRPSLTRPRDVATNHG
jgi:hypothetical protein